MCFFLSLFYDAKLVRVLRNVREIRKPGSKIYHPRVGGLRVGIRRQQQGSVVREDITHQGQGKSKRAQARRGARAGSKLGARTVYDVGVVRVRQDQPGQQVQKVRRDAFR